MSIERVRAYFRAQDAEHLIHEFPVSSATVELAAKAVGVEPARIAKTLSFKKEDHALLVVAAGDAKVDNRKFKDTFGLKAKMLTPEEVVALTNHAIGGVCPFAVPENAEIYLDISLKRFDKIYPAAGSANSCVELTCPELEHYAAAKGWADVCKGWEGDFVS
ncbi:MAG: YbaK/EbsC family protein [Eubacteriales bacterium]|nr:YbaK/EbsC family protein [Eubacteriales bacterium]